MIKQCNICKIARHGTHACPLYVYGYPYPNRYQAKVDGDEDAQVNRYVDRRDAARGK